MKNLGKSSRGHSQGVPKNFTALWGALRGHLCDSTGLQTLRTVVLLVVVVVLGVVVSTEAFSFHNRSSSNFATYTLVTTLSTIAACRIFKCHVLI